MQTQELLAILKSQDLHPILVEEDATRTVRPGLVMIGDLDQFVGAVKALGEKVVFITTRRAQEDDFLYETEVDGEDTGGDDYNPVQLIPLAQFCPELDGLRTHLDQECVFKLSVYFKQSALHFSINESWWSQLQALRCFVEYLGV
jgi:hypothetical protein